MFRLRKWYLDLVTADGVAFIGYAARARLLGMPVQFGSTFLSNGREQAEEEHARAPFPESGPDGVVWHAPRLGVLGRWARVVPAFSATLVDSPAGRIDWHCHVPGGMASVAHGGYSWVGRGYAEELVMTLAPWKMPFRTLRWGRFLSAHQAVAWIDWREGLDRTWVVHNGELDEGARVHGDSIELTRGRLTLTVPPRVLRDGLIADAAFPRARWAGKLLPNGLSRARETKFLSRGQYRDAAGVEEGFALHEVCTWR